MLYAPVCGISKANIVSNILYIFAMLTFNPHKLVFFLGVENTPKIMLLYVFDP